MVKFLKQDIFMSVIQLSFANLQFKDQFIQIKKEKLHSNELELKKILSPLVSRLTFLHLQ